MNRLKNSTSAYLRSAAHQPIHWYEWGPEAFEAARREDKPILLDIGAVWCHWCHVIDRESYEETEIAKRINDSFIPIKVDVDARPDIDRRYQEVVQALTGQGGWPLTAFLTPEGEVIYGGTYFPPEDRWGMPGMKTVLARVAQTYRDNKSSVVAQAKRLHEELYRVSEQNLRAGELSPQLPDRILSDIVNSFDEEHGGFGSAPKFPPATALELLLRRAFFTGDEKTLGMVTKTLEAMAAGGMRDQLGGAFHRYSVDRVWRVPHFEVMLYAEAELLKIYALGYQWTKAPRYAEVIQELLGYLKTTLSDQQRGGFYGSQDADATPDDDGDYWTWTLAEAKGVLDPAEWEAAAPAYGIEEQGEMRENPAKNVLYQTAPIESLAKLLQKPEPDLRAILARAKVKLLAARNKRKAPTVDQAVYTNWNGLMVSGMLAAADALDDEAARAFALKTLDRIWAQGYRPGQGLSHVIRENSSQPRGFLDDYASLLNALLDAYGSAQNPLYLERARQLAEEMISRFWDQDQGGFFDVESLEHEAIQILKQRRKPIQDAPTPAANSAAAIGLDRLYQITGKSSYRELAEKTLKAFAGTAPEYGLFSASFGIALDAHFQEPAKVVIVGKIGDPKTISLLKAALAPYRPDRVIQVVGPSAEKPEHTAFVCAGTQCAAPVTEPEALERLVASFGLAKRVSQ